MNKSFKSVLNRSTGTYVAASENVKSSGKSAKSKLSMKVASASLALGASIAMLSSGNATADDSVPVSGYLVDAPDAASGTQATSSDEANVTINDDSSASTDDSGGAKRLGSSMLGAQLLGAAPTGGSVLYNDSTNDAITFVGTAGTKLSNVAAGTISATSMDAVNGSQLFHLTDGSSVVNSAYVKVGGAGNGTDNINVTQNSKYVAIGSGVSISEQLPGLTGAYNVAIGSGASISSNNGTGAIAIGGLSVSNASGTAVGYKASAGGSNAALGANATATGYGNLALGSSSTASANYTVAVGTSATASASNSVALGYGAVANRGNSVSVGNSSSQNQIVNVAAGTQATDVVNYGQLMAAGLKTDTNGAATNAFVAYDDKTASTITLSATGTKITNVAAGNVTSATSTDAVNGSQLYATNQSVVANTTAIAANAADIATNVSDIAQNTSDISTINTQVGTLNTQIADAVKYDSAAHDSITLDGTAGTKITNVAAGDVSSATSTDAVNGSQLYATNQNVAANTTAIAANTADIATNAAAISTNTTDISTLNTQAANAVKYASAAHNSITLDGTAGTKITNVAAGTLSATSTDAVNGAQLFHVTDGTSVINSAYVKVGGANNGTDNAVLSGSGVAIGASAKADTDTVAVGGNAVATSNGMYGSMAIGTSANGGAGGTAIGYHTLSTGIASVALGKTATAGGGVFNSFGRRGHGKRIQLGGDRAGFGRHRE